MTRVTLACITMSGNEYVLYERDGTPTFPHDALRDGEQPADAARRVVSDWTGTAAPKLELIDFRAEQGELVLVLRALLTDAPKGDPTRAPRMGLPEKVGRFTGREVDEMLKTSLSYKLTRG